jgi:hypothetical protein
MSVLVANCGLPVGRRYNTTYTRVSEKEWGTADLVKNLIEANDGKEIRHPPTTTTTTIAIAIAIACATASSQQSLQLLILWLFRITNNYSAIASQPGGPAAWLRRTLDMNLMLNYHALIHFGGTW